MNVNLVISNIIVAYINKLWHISIIIYSKPTREAREQIID